MEKLRISRRDFMNGVAMSLAAGSYLSPLELLAKSTAPYPPALMGLAFGIIAILTVLFYSFTIEVNESCITWYFRPGFWRKMLPLEEIGDCRTVQNPICGALGLGILEPVGSIMCPVYWLWKSV